MFSDMIPFMSYDTTIHINCCPKMFRWDPRQVQKSLTRPDEHILLHARMTLLLRHNGREGVSTHQSHDCLLVCRHRSKKTSKLRVTGLCAGNSPVTGEFSPHRASNAENVSIWWSHYGSATDSENTNTWIASLKQCFHFLLVFDFEWGHICS